VSVYGGGYIFACDNPADAVRWGAKMDWEFNKGMGTGKISIVSFTPGVEKWEKDTADPLSQAMNKGSWLKAATTIKPEQIQGVTVLSQAMVQAAVAGKDVHLAAKPKCPHCGSTDYGLMPSDFETAKCNACGKNWNHGIVEGINDPKMARKPMHDDSGATTGLRNKPDYGESDSYVSEMNRMNSMGSWKNPLLKKAASQIYVCNNPKCKPILVNGVPKAGRGVEKEFKLWSPVGDQQTPACIACNQPMQPKPKTAAGEQAVQMHETPKFLPPRDDMKRHLDESVQKEIDNGVDAPEQEGIKVGDDSSYDADLDQREEHFNDQVSDMNREARNAFNEDQYMIDEAQAAGLTLDQLWQEYGNDYANEFFQSRQGSKQAVKIEEGTTACPKCSSSITEEVSDGETKGESGSARLFECKDCRHLFSL
jgi:transposase-like protein